MNYLTGVLVLLGGVTSLAAAFAAYKASNAGGDYTGLGTEPGTLEGSHGYHELARMQGALRAGEMNRRAAYWAAASALTGVALAVAGLWFLATAS